MNSRISTVTARRIWDSRGRPTVEVDITLESGIKGRGAAPAGASRGSNEAIDLRDGGDRLAGLDVQDALENVRSLIAPRLRGMDVRDQGLVDAALIELDGTPNKGRLGGNVTVATSMAAAHAAAAASGEPLWRYLADGGPVTLPLPEIQIFGGGAHAGRRVDIQDFLVMPLGAQSFQHAMVMTSEVYRAAGELMAEKGSAFGVADEGGWWPDFRSNEEALDVLARALARSGYDDGRMMISLDVAASEFGRDGHYRLALEDRSFDRREWLDQLQAWRRAYPIISLEDPFGEDDLEGMQAVTAAMGEDLQIIGDDFLVTSAVRVKDAQDHQACNAVLIKPNQVGTLTEAKAALDAAKAKDWGTVISARSGETEDVTIAHLAVGWAAGQLKVGSFTRSERMAKWNEVIRIEEELGAQADYVGARALPVATPAR